MRAKWLALVGVVCGQAAGDEVVKNFVNPPALYTNQGALIHILRADPDRTGIGTQAFVGNGKELSKVGIVWGISDVWGNWNQGDLNELEWVFRFHPDPMNPPWSMYVHYDPPLQPNWECVFASPMNPGWETVIGSFLGVLDWRYAEVDVSHLHIATVPGQLHLTALVPRSKLYPLEGAYAIIALANWGPGAVGPVSDWYQRGDDVGGELGPAQLINLPIPADYSAAYVTVRHPADIDGDDDCDSNDFLLFVNCIQGPEIVPNGCHKSDQDRDGDIDLYDFARLQICFAGPGVPPGCDP